MSARTPESAAAQQRLAGLVSPVIREAGFDLEDLVLTPMGRRSLLRVVIDRDEGVGLDDIAGMSHAISEVLDADQGPMGKAPYVLEVTSPGVDRPLTEARHWRRAVGRLVEVTVLDPSTDDAPDAVPAEPLRARVGGFDGTSVTLQLDGSERVVPLAELGEGRVQLEFRRPAAGGLDTGSTNASDQSERRKRRASRASRARTGRAT